MLPTNLPDLNKDAAGFVAGVGPVVRGRNASANEKEIRRQTQLVMLRPQVERRLPDRRVETRVPFPYPIHVTPIETDGHTHVGETVVVFGKNLSTLGCDFYHRDPLPHRRVIASFALPHDAWVGLLLELNWCRFSRHGFYDSGGRFLSVIESPLPLMEAIKADAALLMREFP